MFSASFTERPIGVEFVSLALVAFTIAKMIIDNYKFNKLTVNYSDFYLFISKLISTSPYLGAFNTLQEHHESLPSGMVELGQTALATKIGEVRIIKAKEMISNMAVPLVAD